MFSAAETFDEPYTDADEDRLKNFYNTRLEIEPCCNVALGEPVEVTIWFRTDGPFSKADITLYIDLPSTLEPLLPSNNKCDFLLKLGSKKHEYRITPRSRSECIFRLYMPWWPWSSMRLDFFFECRHPTQTTERIHETNIGVFSRNLNVSITFLPRFPLSIPTRSIYRVHVRHTNA